MNGGIFGLAARLWRAFFGLTRRDIRARAAEEEAARAERYRLVREIEDQDRLQRALVEAVQDASPDETARVARRIFAERRKSGVGDGRHITWAEFHAALNKERLERERDPRKSHGEGGR